MAETLNLLVYEDLVVKADYSCVILVIPSGGPRRRRNRLIFRIPEKYLAFKVPKIRKMRRET